MQGYLHTLLLAPAAGVANNIAASQSPGAGAITLNGSVGTGNLDIARRIIITSAGNDSGITFTLTGTDRYGRAQSETIAGANATVAQTTKDFLSVSSVTHTGSVAGAITIGTNGVASTAPLIVDYFASRANIGIALSGTGTFSANIECSRSDLSPNNTNLLAWDLASGNPVWFVPTAFSAKSALTADEIPGSITMIRLTTASFTAPATVKAEIVLPLAAGRF